MQCSFSDNLLFSKKLCIFAVQLKQCVLKKKVKGKDSLGGFEFLNDEDHQSLYYMWDRIISSQDELRDLLYYLKQSSYCKEKFQDNDLMPHLTKLEGVITQLDVLTDDVAEVFKNKGLLVKEK